eukprot:401009_1
MSMFNRGHKKTSSQANPGPLKQDSAQAALIKTPTQNRNSVNDGKKQMTSGDGGAAAPAKEILVFEDGSMYQGAVQDDLPHGTGTWSSTEGECYEGEWKWGKRSG